MKNKAWSEAMKYQKFAAKMRTDISLTRKSDKITEKQANAIQQEIEYILDSRDIIYPPSLKKIGFDQDMKVDEKRKILDYPAYKPNHGINEKKFLEFMQRSSEKANKLNWRFRIAEEAEQKQKEGWYPFFITLTVDPKIIDAEIMWKQGREWQKLVRRLATIATIKLGHPPYWKKTTKYNYRPVTDYLTYACVLEHGKSREHHHVHALIWLRDIPEEWKLCPNRNATGKYRIHNRCRVLETYWKLGKCEANYFRSLGDIWEIKHKFCLPLRDGKPMRVAPANAAGAYITKYLQKEHKEWQHRMKATRNLGMKRLKKVISNLPQHQVKALTWRAMTSQSCLSLTMTHTVPIGLLRSIAKQQSFFNQYHARELDSKTQTLIPSKPFIKMLKSVQDGARPDRMPFAEFYDWLSRLLPVQTEYCDSLLTEAHELIGQYWPPQTMRHQHIKFGGNDIGLA